MAEAKQATAAAIDTLRDGVRFAVVAGTQRATIVYPGEQEPLPATPATRADAKAAVSKLVANGGTAIGQWLTRVNQLVTGHQDKICHVILLTDGKNEYEAATDLDAALDACRGRFSCDARGVGADWEPDELSTIATGLFGSWDLVRDPRQLEDDFRAMARRAMDKAVPDVMLRLWTPKGATVRLLRQVAPTIEELTGRRVEVGGRSGEYPTGSWGRETRDYHLRVHLDPGAVGDEVLAVRASAVAAMQDYDGLEVLAAGLVRAVWTDDSALCSRVDPTVAHYTGQEELYEAIRNGREARATGDVDAAAAWFREALQRSEHLGCEDTVRLVQTVYERATGRVRPLGEEREAERMDAIELHRQSSKTTPVRPVNG